MKKLLGCLLLLCAPLAGWSAEIDLNTADADTIARELDGVGSARARAIVQYRKQFGRFASVDDLLNVSGIGEQILEANRQKIVLSANR